MDEESRQMLSSRNFISSSTREPDSIWNRSHNLPQQINIRRNPLPVSTQIPTTDNDHRQTYPPNLLGHHLHFSSHIDNTTPSLLPHKQANPNNEQTNGLSLEKIQEKVGIDNTILGARFLFNRCITYPFIIYSRQCQIVPYNSVGTLYSAPLRTLSVMNNITHHQGITSWWRGFKAYVIYLLGRPFAAAALTWLAERKSRNKRLSSTLNWLRYHSIQLFVNGLSYVVFLPLTSFIFVEQLQHTIQSTYSSDYEGFREFTMERPLFISNDPSKRLSFLQLVVPTVITSILYDILAQQLTGGTTRLLNTSKANVSTKFSLRQLLTKLWASYISSILVDIVLYPLRTVTIRLHAQGLPILVENVDTGTNVQFVTTFYTGPIDCVQGIWEAEGIMGFYKGLSSVLLQHFVHGLLLVAVWRGVIYWEQWKSQKA